MRSVSSYLARERDFGFPVGSAEWYYLREMERRGELDGVKVSQEAGFMSNETIIITRDGEERRLRHD